MFQESFFKVEDPPLSFKKEIQDQQKLIDVRIGTFLLFCRATRRQKGFVKNS